VLATVRKHFPDHPGSLDSFAWPVTRADALQALAAFIRERLPGFGAHQDAMWTDAPSCGTACWPRPSTSSFSTRAK
jgi:deoxyribodipyrimidine photolyase-related protein